MSKEAGKKDGKKKNPLKVVTPKARLSFPDLFKPRAMEREDGTMSDEKYGAQFLFPKKTDLAPLKEVVKLAIKEKWGETPPKGLVLPFKDGDQKDLEGYEDTIVVSANSKFKPQIINQALEKIESADEIYAGCYVRGAIVAYTWEAKNKKGQILKRGVSFNLESIQFLADGEPFVRRPDATEDFEAVDDGSNDDDNFETNSASDDDDSWLND